jgi:hypothetical protein
MDYTDKKYNEELQKCPYHSQLQAQEKDKSESDEPNTGEWDDQRDDANENKEGYDEDRNDNSGGAGSTGSAAVNS